MEKIILFSTHCPRCGLLEQRLKEKNIPFELCTDENKMEQLGLTYVPVLSVNGKLLNFKEALSFINGE